MIILNFSHSLTEEQVRQVEEKTNEKIEEVRQISVFFEHDKPYEEQVNNLIEACNLSSKEWQTLPILIMPPSFNFIAVTLLAALHGIMGYFPPVIRLKPVTGTTPQRFEVAEIINLQKIRDNYRRLRG